MGRDGGSVCDRRPGSLRFWGRRCARCTSQPIIPSFAGLLILAAGRGLDPYHPERAVAAFGRRTSVPRQLGRKSRKDKELPEPERQSLQREFFFCYMLDKDYANDYIGVCFRINPERRREQGQQLGVSPNTLPRTFGRGCFLKSAPGWSGESRLHRHFVRDDPRVKVVAHGLLPGGFLRSWRHGTSVPTLLEGSAMTRGYVALAFCVTGARP